LGGFFHKKWPISGNCREKFETKNTNSLKINGLVFVPCAQSGDRMSAFWGIANTIAKPGKTAIGNVEAVFLPIASICTDLQKNSNKSGKSRDKSGKSREKVLYLHQQ
jgi:hypothetical protein